MKKPTLKSLVKKYSKAKLKFKSYYKFSFRYVGTTPQGDAIEVSNCGNGDDIYRSDLDAEMTLGQLDNELILDYIKVGELEVWEEE